MIRLAEMQDIPAILAILIRLGFVRTMEIWSVASFLSNRQLVEEDIRASPAMSLKSWASCWNLYVHHRIDPTYQEIEGAWHFQYGTIHRIASNGQVRGSGLPVFLTFVCSKFPISALFCMRDNHPIQAAIHRGFSQCGTIYLPDGSSFLLWLPSIKNLLRADFCIIVNIFLNSWRPHVGCCCDDCCLNFNCFRALPMATPIPASHSIR